MAGRHGYSGAKPPSDGGRPRASGRQRLMRMAPPANDNRGQGIRLGRLRFTGLRLAAGPPLALAPLATAAGLAPG